MRLVKRLAAAGAFVFLVLAGLSLWFGGVAATQEDTSSWSDPQAHPWLVAAGFLAFAAFLCFACWLAIPGRRRD